LNLLLPEYSYSDFTAHSGFPSRLVSHLPVTALSLTAGPIFKKSHKNMIQVEKYQKISALTHI